jgi:hypothetical protein
MRPYKDIQIGDVYQRIGQGITWTVIEKDDDEKMVAISCSYKHPTYPDPIWRRNTDPIFNRRVSS